MLRKLLIEELSRDDKNEIEDIIDDKLSDYDDDVKDIFYEELESTDSEDVVKEISVDTLEQLFKTLWQRRSSWRGGVK